MARAAHAHERTRVEQARLLKAGNVLAEHAVELVGLAPALDLGHRQGVRVQVVKPLQVRGVDDDLARIARLEEEHVPPGEAERALGHGALRGARKAADGEAAGAVHLVGVVLQAGELLVVRADVGAGALDVHVVDAQHHGHGLGVPVLGLPR